MSKKPKEAERKFIRKLPVKLKAHEVQERQVEVLDLMTQEDAKRAALAAVQKPIKDEIKELVVRREGLRRVLKEGHEERDVQCVEQKDFKSGEVWDLRADTRQEVPGSRRTMTAEERQEVFPEIGKPARGKGLRSAPNNLDDLDHADPPAANE